MRLTSRSPLRWAAALALAGAPLVTPAPASAASGTLCPDVQAGDVTEDATGPSTPLERLGWAALAEEVGPGLPGAGVGVAVVDSGVSPAAERVPVAERVSFGYRDEVVDSHGTVVASLVAGGEAPGGRPVGMAPGARVVDVRVYDADSGSAEDRTLQTTAVVDGLTWVARNARRLGIEVVVVAGAVPRSEDLDRVVAGLADDVVLVAAGGNRPAEEDAGFLSGFATPAPGQDAGSVVFPAGYDGVLAVSAAASPAGPDPYDVVLPSSATDVVAPTQGALGYGLNGRACVVDQVATSWAAAYVAGLAAVLAAEYPDDTPAQLRARLATTAAGAADLPTRMTGAGVVQPVEAVSRPLDIRPSGEVRTAGSRPARQRPLEVAEPAPDPVAEIGAVLVRWGLPAAGVLAIAALLRPVLARRRP